MRRLHVARSSQQWRRADSLAGYIRQARAEHRPKPDWPNPVGLRWSRLWTSREPRGTDHASDDPGRPGTSPGRGGITFKVTPHTARHSFCTNWIQDSGHDEHSMTKLSRQVGASVARLRATYVHLEYSPEDWEHMRTLGARQPTQAAVFQGR